MILANGLLNLLGSHIHELLLHALQELLLKRRQALLCRDALGLKDAAHLVEPLGPRQPHLRRHRRVLVQLVTRLAQSEPSSDRT